MTPTLAMDTVWSKPGGKPVRHTSWHWTAIVSPDGRLASAAARALAGIGEDRGYWHHRDYIHPSCLMIARQTLDDFSLTFLDEKDRPSRFDVAERISRELQRRGYRLAGLQRTGALQRGSTAEPVYLGSEYEGIVYHQWYTTRAATTTIDRVDDVPMGAIVILCAKYWTDTMPNRVN